MSEDIWTHTARHLRSEEERLQNALRDAREAQVILQAIKLQYGLKRATGAQIERWCAAYRRDGEPGLQPVPRTCQQGRRTPEQRARMSASAKIRWAKKRATANAVTPSTHIGPGRAG